MAETISNWFLSLSSNTKHHVIQTNGMSNGFHTLLSFSTDEAYYSTGVYTSAMLVSNCLDTLFRELIEGYGSVRNVPLWCVLSYLESIALLTCSEYLHNRPLRGTLWHMPPHPLTQ